MENVRNFKGYNVKDLKKIDIQEIGTYGEYEYDEDDVVEFLNQFLKEYDHYLVVAYNSNWRGQTGYRFTDNIIDTINRNYDVTQNIIGGTNSKKSLLIKEYHHDVPMGHETIIIGLTEKEYEKLDYSSVEDIIKFADTKRDKIIRF